MDWSFLYCRYFHGNDKQNMNLAWTRRNIKKLAYTKSVNYGVWQAEYTRIKSERNWQLNTVLTKLLQIIPKSFLKSWFEAMKVWKCMVWSWKKKIKQKTISRLLKKQVWKKYGNYGMECASLTPLSENQTKKLISTFWNVWLFSSASLSLFWKKNDKQYDWKGRNPYSRCAKQKW